MHTRRDCPVAGCSFHAWPPGTTRRDLDGPVERAMVGARRPDVRSRPSSRTDAVAMEIVVSEMNSMVQRLSNELEQQRSKSRYDGRAVIEAGKKRRRQLIGQVGRHGIGSL